MIKYIINEEGRVVALKDFGNVKIGDVGGFVESDDSLSQDGDCWIYDNAKVFDKARVYGNAKVHGYAHVYGDAHVSGNAKISGDVKISGDDCVYDYAWVYGDARVFNNEDTLGEPLIESMNEVVDHHKEQALKFDGNYMEKPPLELLSGRVMEEVAQVLGHAAANKYEKWNWQKGFEFSRLISSSLRHVYKFKRGEDNDDESGLSHLSHAIANLMFLRHQMLINKGADDRGEL